MRAGVTIVARQPRQNALLGLVELGLSFAWSEDRVRFWPTGLFRFPGSEMLELNGHKDAQHLVGFYQTLFPAWQIAMVDVTDPLSPIVIDWESWQTAVDKYCRRNPPFHMCE